MSPDKRIIGAVGGFVGVFPEGGSSPAVSPDRAKTVMSLITDYGNACYHRDDSRMDRLREQIRQRIIELEAKANG